MGAFSRQNSLVTVFDFSADASATFQHVAERSPFFVSKANYAHFSQRVVRIDIIDRNHKTGRCFVTEIAKMEGNDFYSNTYDYNDGLYNVEASEDIHERLANGKRNLFS